MRIITILFMGLCLTACAPGPLKFEKAGSTKDEYEIAMAKCKNELAVARHNITSINRQRSFIKNCMRVEGWKIKEENN